MPGDLAKLQETLGYTFKNLALLQQALDRNVCYSENGVETRYFESLEFLGDRVLNLCVADTITALHPTWASKELNPVYVHYTRNTDDASQHGGPLYRIAKALQLEQYLTLSPGTPLDKAGKRGKAKQKSEKTKEWNLSDHMEALFGAIFKDSNFETAARIIKHWFDQLGLSNTDHQSVSNFGESQSMTSDLSIAKSSQDTEYTRFIAYIARGNLEKLKQPLFRPTHHKQLVYALLVALSNNRTNVIPFLMTTYSYDIDTIREALDDPSMAVSSKTYLTVLLIKKMIEALQANTLDEMDQAELFLNLVQYSLLDYLKTLPISVSEDTIKAGVRLALDANNTNIVCLLIKRYILPVEFLQDIANTEGMAVDLRNFLHKQINKRNIPSKGPASPGEIEEGLYPTEKKAITSEFLSHHPNSVWQENGSSKNPSQKHPNSSNSPKRKNKSEL